MTMAQRGVGVTRPNLAVPVQGCPCSVRPAKPRDEEGGGRKENRQGWCPQTTGPESAGPFRTRDAEDKTQGSSEKLGNGKWQAKKKKRACNSLMTVCTKS